MSDAENPAPEKVPTKRRQVDDPNVLTPWLYEWLEREDLTKGQRRILQAEVDRRKAAKKTRTFVVAIIVGREGVTPNQAGALLEVLGKRPPTALFMLSDTFIRLRKVLRPWTESVFVNDDMQSMVRTADHVLCFARPGAQTGIAWDAMRYAKHRGKTVQLFMQTGEESPLTKG